MVTMTSTRRVRWSKCGRVQISPHAWRVIRSWKSELNEFLLAIDLSTQASPSTLRRCAMPSSRRFWSSIDFSRHCEFGTGLGPILMDETNAAVIARLDRATQYSGDVLDESKGGGRLAP